MSLSVGVGAGVNGMGASPHSAGTLADLARSGLEPSDIRCRPLDLAERTMCGVPPVADGYVIPYYEVDGTPLPFYRVKLLQHNPKYLQVKNTKNHVYFPLRFLQTLQRAKYKYVLFTEGEKKAALATKLGHPCVAFGGVDSWRNRILVLPKGTMFAQHPQFADLIGAKIPQHSYHLVEEAFSTYAYGFESLLQMLLPKETQLIIVYDTDSKLGVKPDVQRAAASLGFTMRTKGFHSTQIKQIVLPALEGRDSTSLDDFLMSEDGPQRFQALLQQALVARNQFPIHPNICEFISKRLSKSKLNRKDLQQLSMMILADMDARGVRMFAPNESQAYYFENKRHMLMPVHLNNPQPAATQESDFGRYLYKTYNFAMAPDNRLTQWLGAQYFGEGELMHVDPYRVVTAKAQDAIRYQIDDGTYAKVSLGRPLEVVPNGHDGVLFESNAVRPLNKEALLQHYQTLSKQPLTMWWDEVLQTVRLKDSSQQGRQLIALLYYASPWLHRWRGTQLPAELIIGEAGSGKSTLCELRLQILTGSPTLRNAPGDLKDWYASIAGSGGLHITDNVVLKDKQLAQRLSDEICRLVTEPDPHIEMRKLYTNAELTRLRVDSVFGFTAIAMPFQNVDILQRSVVIELEKDLSRTLSYDSNWKDRQLLSRGGREAWIAHHLLVLQRFLQVAEREWSPQYLAKHRLINLEQVLMIMARVFGLDPTWIPNYFSGSTEASIAESDWALEGLLAYAKEQAFMHNYEDGRWNRFTAADISHWASISDDYGECFALNNVRKLGRYLKQHRATVSQVAFLEEAGVVGNKPTYKIDLGRIRGKT